ncbi:unnamed protein product [Rotaria magnacalcarata]|uniref:G-protein coupled receptors family 1 profile domain-containing protein n=1 Tax=Rotaria magnacalcarata TaxID=392030 RepID=A0A816C5J8_9BILA|nr:unnamed protein product [Rotaria magnacalcarata]CAF4850435.1 unnamed protein product [Rotaria magnacalcarata]CAF4896745.1 unnamed protein product [Rotaria magnacalcarata]
MSNVTDSSTIDLINNISAQINRYITLFVLLFGTIGNLLNTLVLSQPSLRSNPCVLYFLGSSISSLGIMLVGLPTRFIGVWISTDPTNTNAFLCKSRIFLLYGFRTTSVWLIVFATVDRWFVSSFRVTRRFLSSRRIAHKSIFIIHILSFLLWSQTLYCYNTDRIQAPLTCYGMSPICRIFNDVTYAITTVLIPSVLMLIFGFLTIHNINRSQRAVVPFMGTIHGISALNMRKRKKKNRFNKGSLTGMLLLQVILLTLFSLPQALQQLYLTFTISTIRSPLRKAIENFIININFSLTYVGNSIPFYIYTLTGILFRRTFIQLIRSIYRQLILFLCIIFINLSHRPFPATR